MKRYSLFLATFALATFFFSCTREEMNDQETIGTGQTASDATSDETTAGEGTEEFEPYIPEGEAVTLTFTLLREDEDETSKTYYDGSTHGWSEGDQIKIIWGTGNQDCTTATVDHETGTVDVTVRAADTYYAVYPADGGFALRENGQIDFNIPWSVQYGTYSPTDTFLGDQFGKANMMAARAYRSNTFYFKNLTHIVKFQYASSTYHHFRFRSNSGGVKLSGTFGVSFVSENSISFVAKQSDIAATPADGDGFIQLEGVRIATDTDQYYYFAVPVNANFSNGYGFQARSNWSGGAWDVNASVASAINRRALTSTAATRISNLGDIGGYLHRNWFITPNGTGSGSSWADAGGIPLLLNLLGKSTADGGLNSTRRLNNARIYMREGTYNFQSNPDWEDDYPDAFSTGGLTFDSDAWSGGVIKNITKIYGGYPSSYTTGTTTTGADPTNHPTVWRSNRGASDRIFHADGCIFNDWTFDGISFEGGGTGIAVSGQAFLFDNGTSGKVTFNACSFTNFYSTVSSGTYYGGGAVLVDTNGDLDLAFTDCTFDTNWADRGAAVVLHNTASGSDISFTNCSFTQHRADGNGGVFYLYGGAKASFEGCDFSHHTDVTYDASAGGAGSIQSGASLTLANCDFDAFTANGVGGAILNHGDLIINGGSFTDCKATTNSSHPNHATFGGAIFSDGSVTVTGTTFDSNQSLAYGTKTQNEGGGAIATSGGTLTINGCTFVNNSSPKGGAVYARNATVTIQDDSGTRTTFSGNEAGGRTDATTETVYQIPMNIGGALAVVGSSVLEVSDTDFGTTSSAGNNVALSTNASTNTTKEIGGGCVFLDDRSYAYSGVGSLDPTDAANVSSLVGARDEQTVSFTNCKFYGNGGSGTGRGGALVINNADANSTALFTGCTFNGNSTLAEGGTFYLCEGSHASLDNTTVTGFGMTGSQVATLGGGLYNAGTLTLQDATVEECNTGSNYGAGIYNIGSLVVSGCTIQNNKNTTRGGGIWSKGPMTIEDSVFSGNYSDNGAGIHCDSSSDSAGDYDCSAWIYQTTFQSNMAKNGSALRVYGNINSFALVKVFNCLFDSNNASGTSNNGGCVSVHDYSRIILANSTLRNTGQYNGNGNGAAIALVASNDPRIYVMSCTFAENLLDFGRNSTNLVVRNSIFTNNMSNANPNRRSSIIGDNRYDNTQNNNVVATQTGLAASCLQSYDDGVYPLNSTFSTHYSQGMSVSTLKGLSYDTITLSTAEKAYLGFDQKGNPRSGSIMGAYVLTE